MNRALPWVLALGTVAIGAVGVWSQQAGGVLAYADETPIRLGAPAPAVVDVLELVAGDAVSAGTAVATLTLLPGPNGLGGGTMPLTSPIDAVVGQVHAAQGSTVVGGAPLVDLVPPGTLRVIACLDEHEAATVSLGDHAVVHPVGGDALRAEVVGFAPEVTEADARCRTWSVRPAYVRETYLGLLEGSITPGARATVRFEGPP